jgi:hypothetical protein
MRHSFQSLAVAFALAAASASIPAIAQDSPNTSPTRRNSGDAFSFGSPLRTQDSIISGNSAFANPNIVNGIARGARTGTTHITPVPEPSQWAMMLAGLALVGFIVRRNSNRKKDD